MFHFRAIANQRKKNVVWDEESLTRASYWPVMIFNSAVHQQEGHSGQNAGKRESHVDKR
jgi:hypothetical protein